MPSQKKVAMDEGARVANDQVLMTLVSICVLHERFSLGEVSGATKAEYETLSAKHTDAPDAALCG